MIMKPEVLSHIVDVHCHPTDAPFISPNAMEQLGITICAMSSHKDDQKRVAALAEAYPDKVIPCFGYHPWFSYLISLDATVSKEDHYRSLLLRTPSKVTDDEACTFTRLLPMLPDPTPLCDVLSELRANLIRFPNAMVGEVGLDRVFRIPFDYFAEDRELTTFTIPLDHQVAILKAQFELAIELKRNISIHSVKAQQATLDLLRELQQKHGESWYKISIDMHSCGFSPETWRQTEKLFSNVFISLSTVINHKHSNLKRLIAQASHDRLLVESDFNDVEKCTQQVLLILELMAEVKGWNIEENWTEGDNHSEKGAVHRLEDNWKRFQAGNHSPPKRSKRARQRKLLESSEESTGDMN